MSRDLVGFRSCFVSRWATPVTKPVVGASQCTIEVVRFAHTQGDSQVRSSGGWACFAAVRNGAVRDLTLTLLKSGDSLVAYHSH